MMIAPERYKLGSCIILENRIKNVENVAKGNNVLMNEIPEKKGKKIWKDENHFTPEIRAGYRSTACYQGGKGGGLGF